MQLGPGSVLEAIADAVVVIDVEGRIVHANAAAEQLSGFTRAELAALRIAQLFVDDDAGLRTAVRERLVAEAEIVRRENGWLIPKTGERVPVAMSASPVVRPDGVTENIVLVARDMRELRRLIADREAEIARREAAEIELRRVMASIAERLDQTRAQLVLAERRATLGTLAAGVGHELRNMAQILSGSISLLEESRVAADDDVSLAVTDLRRVADHVTTHARRMLDLAKPGPEHVRALDLARVVREVVAMLEGAGKLRAIETVLAVPDTAVLVTVNRTRIEQILVNLLINAADALRDMRGQILIAIHVDEARQRVVVEVSDSGPGIPPDVLPHVFEPFFTTKGDTHGTGLGLPVAREIARSYAGDLSVKSEVGVGATFTFDLPLSPVVSQQL